jgi:hypothetical protein
MTRPVVGSVTVYAALMAARPAREPCSRNELLASIHSGNRDRRELALWSCALAIGACETRVRDWTGDGMGVLWFHRVRAGNVEPHSHTAARRSPRQIGGSTWRPRRSSRAEVTPIRIPPPDFSQRWTAPDSGSACCAAVVRGYHVLRRISQGASRCARVQTCPQTPTVDASAPSVTARPE